MNIFQRVEKDTSWIRFNHSKALINTNQYDHEVYLKKKVASQHMHTDIIRIDSTISNLNTEISGIKSSITQILEILNGKHTNH